jgi:hypothetical protein
MNQTGRDGASASWAAFLVLAFVILGLAGLFGTYAASIPLQRALARETALDAALAAAHGPDPQGAIEALRPQLGESADALLPVGGDMDARIMQERREMRARLGREAAAATTRARWIIGIVTLMASVMGVFILRAARP